MDTEFIRREAVVMLSAKLCESSVSVDDDMEMYPYADGLRLCFRDNYADMTVGEWLGWPLTRIASDVLNPMLDMIVLYLHRGIKH